MVKAPSKYVWQPDEATFARANVVRLMRKHGMNDYWELVRRSQEDPEWFWPAAIEDMGLEFSQPWDEVVDLSRGPEWATWFVGGKLNIAWNCVHRWAERRPDAVAAVGLRRGRIPARADVRRALGRGDEARRGARPPRRRRGRPRGDLPADVAGGGDRLARVRPHRGDPGAGLLRLRGTRCGAASPGLGGEGCDHGAERHAARTRRCRCSRSSRRRGATPRASSMSSSRRGTSFSPTHRASSRRRSSTRRRRTS